MIESLSAPTTRQDGFLAIADYAAIGDGHTLALVGADGAIDWMCLPELDSPSVFGALLDPRRGGSFRLAPAVPFTSRRGYRERTNILETTFETAGGAVRVTEALTIDDSLSAPSRELARRIEGIAGTVPMGWQLEPRFDYGAEQANFTSRGPALVARHGRLQLALRTWDAGEPEVRGGVATGRFEAREGTEALLALHATDEAPLPVPSHGAVLRRLASTERVWRSWITRHTYEGPWREAVERSLLAIRLLADGRTGAITAAGTTSLPEAIGGQRNYDYRFAWVRDLSFTLEALMAVGVEELTHSSLAWLLGATAHTHPSVDPVYKLDGSVLREQHSLPLSGYRDTGPVHIGNQAGTQLQLGGWGDLIAAIWSHVEHGHELHPDAGERLADMVDLLAALWRKRDSGLWELGQQAHYTTSKLSCWTAFQRVLELAERGAVPARRPERWRRERRALRDFIETRLYDERRGYLMKADGDELDCGVLLAARRGYTDPAGPRLQRTIAAIQSELHAGGPLYYRYSGMREQENAFLACSFWMVEALALGGRTDEAAELMDGAVGMANDVGLLSEEIKPEGHALRGNLPQALSHLGLINAAAVLAQVRS